MAIWVADVQLADIPGHVPRREGNVQAGSGVFFIELIYIVDPDGHPHALVGLIAFVRCKGGDVRSPTAPSLTVLAEKDLAFTGANRAKRGRRSPIPELFPTKLGEPCKAGGDIRDI